LLFSSLKHVVYVLIKILSFLFYICNLGGFVN
jgi:hypothetical protein